MKKIFTAGALALFLLSGCAAVDSGMIKDKVRQSGSMKYDCDNKTTGTGKNKKITRSCGFENNPDVCRFWLERHDGLRGWLEVPCETTFNEYEVGEHYPR